MWFHAKWAKLVNWQNRIHHGSGSTSGSGSANLAHFAWNHTDGASWISIRDVQTQKRADSMGGSDSSKDPDPSNSNSNSFVSGSGSGAGSSKNRIRNTSTSNLSCRAHYSLESGFTIRPPLSSVLSQSLHILGQIWLYMNVVNYLSCM